MRSITAQKELVERFSLHYEGLIHLFANAINELDYRGMPEPHIPIIGSNYCASKYKIAFYGIETNKWGLMDSFMDDAKSDPNKAATRNYSVVEDMEYLSWTNNFHTSFWDFIIQFLSTFYQVDINEIRKGKHPELLRSFIWGNTNAIEQYDLQAREAGVKREVYDAIKQESRVFDNLDHLVNIAKPTVLIVLNWGAEGFISDKTDWNYYKINDHLFYYYKRSTQTHIFQTHHPRSIAKRFGFQNVVQELLHQFEICNIWNSLPQKDGAFFEPEGKKSNWLLRNELIADIAAGLIKTHSVMCGQQLVDILNINGITKNNGYAYVHGRGIYKPIQSAWNYYHNILGDEQVAYNIALAYVDSNGDYAYNKY